MEISWNIPNPPRSIPTLLIPAVSIGNVPQLCIDLLLHTLPIQNADAVAILKSNALIPCIGSSDFNDFDDEAKNEHIRAENRNQKSTSNKIRSTNLQLFQLDPNAQTPLYIIQQRSPILQGLASTYAADLAKLIHADLHATDTVMVLSSPASGRRDAQMSRTSIGFHSNGAGSGIEEYSDMRIMMTSHMVRKNSELVHRAKAMGMGLPEGTDASNTLGWDSSSAREEIATDAEVESMTMPHFFAANRKGSFVRGFLEACEALGVSLLIVVVFVHEGDNRMDAVRAASAVSRLLALGSDSQYAVNWRSPKSWEYLYGARSDLYS